MKHVLITIRFTILAFMSVFVAGSIGYAQEAESEYLTWAKLKEALSPSYTVYDSTGHPVGITKDGRHVLAAFPGHEGLKFELYIGNGEEPPTLRTFNPILFFLDGVEQNCGGEPYVRFSDYYATSLDGVTELRQLALLSDGALMYGDHATTPFPLEPMSYTNDFGNCLSTTDTPWEQVDAAIPMKELVVNWELPLSVHRPRSSGE